MSEYEKGVGSRYLLNVHVRETTPQIIHLGF